MNTMYAQQKVPAFEVKQQGEQIKDSSRQMAYRSYRAQYRASVGVLPELDKINTPALAPPMNDVFWPSGVVANAGKSIAKLTGKLIESGFEMGASLMAPNNGFFTKGFQTLCDGISAGIGQDPELMAEFCRRFKALVEPYKAIYGLLFDPDIIPDFEKLEDGRHVHNGLGYHFDRQKQIYLEGTWENDELVFGLIYHPEDGVFIGDVRDDDNWLGVKRDNDEISIGRFDANGLECEEGFVLEMDRQIAFLGPHHQNVIHGMGILLIVSTGGIIKQEYVMGEPLGGWKGRLKKHKAKWDTHKNTFNSIVGRFVK